MAKDAYYFKHDSNARYDPKIQALMEKYGVEGYGRYFMIIEIMRETSHYRLEDKPYVWSSIANQFKCSVEDVKKFVSDCIEEFSLFEMNDGYLISLSLLKRMIHLDEVREKRRLAGKARHYDSTERE